LSLIGRLISKLFRRGGNLATRSQRDQRGRSRRRSVQSSYDASITNDQNRNHWGNTDSLSANAANSYEVRRTLRERSRYETENNSNLTGLFETYICDVVGTCPRLQLSIPGASRAAVRWVEQSFADWCDAIDLGLKLRLMEFTTVRDGESFGIMTTNPAVDSPVKLDLKLYEPDQVDTPFFMWSTETDFCGGKLDQYGNVNEWHFLKYHPGSDIVNTGFEYQSVPASSVLHWYNPRRIGQLRGVPELLSSLSLFAVLRRWTKAALSAAETAANIAGVLESNIPPDDEATEENTAIEAMDEVDIPRNALLTLPYGHKANAFQPSQPTTGYRDFKTEILTEAGQPIGAPEAISTGSSANYNYSSAQLDHGKYRKRIKVRQGDIASRILKRLFRAWLKEALLIPGYLPHGLPSVGEWTLKWMFDSFFPIDPEKEAKADQINLANNTTTYRDIFARSGRNWEDEFEQQKIERDWRSSNGFSNGIAQDPIVSEGPASDTGVDETQRSEDGNAEE